MSTDTPKTNPNLSAEPEKESFAEAALRMGGKSEAEAKLTGAIDRADDQVESLFAPQYQTSNSPVHRIVWNREAPVELFQPEVPAPTASCQKTMDDSMDVVRRHKREGTLLDENGKIADDVLSDLAKAGYWGMLVDQEFGGQGAPMGVFGPFLTRMATVDATVSGLASVHGCIGAVDPVRAFGTDEQKAKFLPMLASGERLSGFALTEPCAGSDLTALRTTAVRDGDDFIVNGEKLFITNAVPGRLVGLVCKIEDKPAVLIVDLPKEENENFQLVSYGLYALKHTNNNGLKFNNLRVPANNLLKPLVGDGLTIAYHGLNRGRVALCAGAAGNMRVMLANLLPWAGYRKTYGEPIVNRELVQRRIGWLSAQIVGCDALVRWCSWLLDQGYRGEMECTIAKIFGSEAQKEASIELFMKTHGGRSFLQGHLFGDNVHEFLAPCIYEGEGEMLGMAFFKSLVKQHGTKYFEPVGRALQAAGIKKPNMANPLHAWKLRHALVPYAKWMAGQTFSRKARPELPGMPKHIADQVRFAVDGLQNVANEVSGTMRKHQLRLADRQCRMAELSQRIQDLVVILVAGMHAGRSNDPVVQEAGNILCWTMQDRLAGRRSSDRYFRAITALGEKVADGGFKSIAAGIDAEEILMPYEQTS